MWKSAKRGWKIGWKLGQPSPPRLKMGRSTNLFEKERIETLELYNLVASRYPENDTELLTKMMQHVRETLATPSKAINHSLISVIIPLFTDNQVLFDMPDWDDNYSMQEWVDLRENL